MERGRKRFRLEEETERRERDGARERGADGERVMTVDNLK
jgi:hypothetical protein